MSDRQYFEWLTDALARFADESGEFAAIAPGRRIDLWLLAAARTNPAIELVRDALGRERTTMRWLDRFERGPEVETVDMNALRDVPGDACDVLMMTRASYLIQDPPAFLAHACRLIRPGGLYIVDWLHGGAARAALDLPGRHIYEGRDYPFVTTYLDTEFVDEFPREFLALIRDAERGTLRQRMAWLFARSGSGDAGRQTPFERIRHALRAAGKSLIGAEDLAPYFKMLFREARYFRPLTGKFYLHLLTVLRPVGK